MADPTADPVAHPRSERTQARARSWLRLDLVVALVLFALGLVARRGTLSTDGLVFDDAWVAIGAGKAGIGQLFNVSVNQPGFTALLSVWARVVSPKAEWMAWPAFVTGAAAAPVVYLVLRRWRIDWPVCVLVSTLVLVAPVHVQYSARVKPYVFEGILILLLAALLPRLARRTWGWPAVAAWVAASVLLSTFTVFVMLAVAVAAVILALHPSGDRLRRWVAVAAQAALSLPYLLFVNGQFDSAEVARGWETVYDAYIEVVADPGRMSRQLGRHTARVGEVFVDGGRAVTLLIVLAALAGLAWESWRGRRRIQAQFLLALPVLALIGSMAEQIPFGPIVGDAAIYPGSRASLWLVPSLVAGLAFGLDAIAAPVRRNLPAAIVPASVALVALAVVLVGVRIDDAPGYPEPGSQSAADFVRTRSGADDVIILLANGFWPYAAAEGVDIRVHADTSLYNGYEPEFVDRRVWSQEAKQTWNGSLAQMRARTANAPRVLIVNGYRGTFDQAVPKMGTALRALGYREQRGIEKENFAVQLWQRPPR